MQRKHIQFYTLKRVNVLLINPLQTHEYRVYHTLFKKKKKKKAPRVVLLDCPPAPTGPQMSCVLASLLVN